MIERRITLAVLFAVAMEAAAVLLWAGGASERLKTVETRLAAQSGAEVRMARLEVRMEIASAQLTRIEKKLDGGGR